jgi:hypothetical protein
MVRVKALTNNVTTLNATLMAGQIGECPPDRAKVLAAKGYVEILNDTDTGDVETTKGDRTERAVSPAAKAAETQTKKG